MCLLHFSVALLQNTTGVTTATTMAAAGGNCPLAPHMGLALCANASNGWATTPRDSRCSFLGGWGCVCPSKHSFVPAMMHRHNIGMFWGPYTPSTASNIISVWSGGCCPSIRCVGAEQMASCGALGGHVHRWKPWFAMVVWVNVGSWRLTSDRPTVGIVKIVYGRFFLFLRGSHTFLTSDPAAK